jgi:hypothetical protein
MIHKETKEEKFIIKLRGITLNHENAKRIQFDRLKKMIINYGNEEITNDFVECQFKKIGPNECSSIQTIDTSKKYKIVNRKGLISNDYVLYPFGFK